MDGTVQHITNSLSCNIPILDDAYFRLEDMHKEGQTVDLEALNIIIKACSQTRQLTKAFETFAALDLFGLKPNINSFNYLLEGT